MGLSFNAFANQIVVNKDFMQKPSHLSWKKPLLFL